MYPNESMALDVPLTYEGTDYGSTMIMIPKKDNKPKVSTKPDTGVLSPIDTGCNTTWEDSEGYNCSQYSEYGWCTKDGEKGPGWNNSWGNISDFKNDEFSALDICCQCGSDSSIEVPESSGDTEVKEEKV